MIETHPWPPFIPDGARILIMGTFPPQPKRWAMDFYYPNLINDFWAIMGIIFMNNREALIDRPNRTFRLPLIKQLLTDHHIALNDTCHQIRRLHDNASDKYLEVIQPVDLHALLSRMPKLQAIATTGEKAADTLASLTLTTPPRMGQMTISSTGLQIWRMPSTSRAYPLAVEKKAEYYADMFRHIGIL